VAIAAGCGARSADDMVLIGNGSFLMGSNDRWAYPADGEGPVREISLDSFRMDAVAVSNEAFASFIEATGYATEAERFGWSFVFAGLLPRTLVAKFTVPPGAHFPWHTHAGPVVGNVTQGELTYVDAEDCVDRPYPAGTAFVDAGHGHVHTAFNHTNQDTVIVATFYEAPASGPLVIPAQAPAGCSK
jgi:hypothetical protein